MKKFLNWEWYALAVLTGEGLAIVYVIGSTVVSVLH